MCRQAFQTIQPCIEVRTSGADYVQANGLRSSRAHEGLLIGGDETFDTLGGCRPGRIVDFLRVSELVTNRLKVRGQAGPAYSLRKPVAVTEEHRFKLGVQHQVGHESVRVEAATHALMNIR